MKELLGLVDRFAGQMASQFLENVFVHLGQDDRGVDFTVLEFADALECPLGDRIGLGGNGERDQDLIGMEPGIVITQVVDLEILDRSQDIFGDPDFLT